MNLTLRIFAGVIDFLQFIFFIVLLAFQFMTPVGGAAVGGVSGAVICYNLSSGAFQSVYNAAACLLGGGILGAGLSALATPIGMAIDVAISCTFGVLLILFLWVTGRFYLMTVVMGFACEMIPGINGFSPGWSMLVHRCIKQYDKDQGKGAATKSVVFGFINGSLRGASPSLARFSTRLARTHDEERTQLAKDGQNRVASVFSGNTEAPQPANRAPLQTKNFDGIRPANDNVPKQQYAQAA